MKKQQGGQFFNTAVGSLLYVLSVVADAFVQAGDIVYENSLSILYHVVFIFAYVLCFYYLQFPTTEIMSVASLVLLHFIFLGAILSIKIKLPVLELGSLIQFGTFSIYVLAMGWILLLVSMGFLLKVYYDLYQAFVVRAGVDIQYGSVRPLLDTWGTTVFYGVVFMWTFYVMEYLKTNDVLLLNVILMAIAMALLIYAIYWFVQGNVLWGTLETVGSLLSLVLLKFLNTAQIDFIGFFTKNQLANSIFILYGIIYVCVCGYAYWLSCKLVETTQSISIPAILQLNPAYHESFAITEKINGKTCTLDNQDPQLYAMLHGSTSDAATMKEIEDKYCAHVTDPPVPTTNPPSITDKLLEMWNKRSETTPAATTAAATATTAAADLPASVPSITSLPMSFNEAPIVDLGTVPPTPVPTSSGMTGSDITLPASILDYVDSIQLRPV